MFRGITKKPEPSQITPETIREVLDFFKDVRSVLHQIQENMEQVPGEHPELRDRLDELERSRALWEAEVEGLMSKASSKYQQARNAEERTKTLVSNDQSSEDGVDDEAALTAYRRAIQDADAEAGGGQEVPALRDGLEIPPISPQMKAKYGIS